MLCGNISKERNTMARVITQYKAFGVYIDEPITTRALQHFVLKWTQANSDLTMDLANTSGTFWSEADNDATGLAAKTTLDQIIAKSETRVSWQAPTIKDPKVQVAAAPAATTEYQITTTSIVPSFAFFTAGAPTSVVFHLVTMLSSQERAVRAGSL